ncbi:MAG TPA: hypothetical protein VD815_07760 [Candidatus Saccharimonadales bacterium]|nr:hypothetical protein [Candidatus Saccharimonadales bacterium]
MRVAYVTSLQTVIAFSNGFGELYFDTKSIDNRFENQSIYGI